MKIKLGADPEFFLKDNEGNFISAHDKVPGTKEEPHPLKKGAVQADGTAVEINIDAANNGEEFSDNLNTVLEQVRGIVDKKFTFNYIPCAMYKMEYFDTLPAKVKRVGCDPDFQGYFATWQPAELAVPKIKAGQAMGGGHLHVGWTENADKTDPSHLWDCTAVTSLLYNYFNYPAYYWDKDNNRRGIYGHQSRMRPKSYGVEWREPSNAWLNYPKLWPWLYDSIQYAVNFLESGGTVKYSNHYNYSTAKDITKIIQDSYGKDAPPMPELT